MTRPRLGVFKHMARGKGKKYHEDRRRFVQVRQLTSMVLWILVKILDRSSMLMFAGKPTGKDDRIQDALRAAIRAAMELDGQIIWICNASELDLETEEDE